MLVCLTFCFVKLRLHGCCHPCSLGCNVNFSRNGPDSHIDLVEKMQKTLKISTKTNSNLLKEIALSEAKEKKNLESKVSL